MNAVITQIISTMMLHVGTQRDHTIVLATAIQQQNVDECRDYTDHCHDDATFRNAKGLYNCTCNSNSTSVIQTSFFITTVTVAMNELV